MKPRFSGRFFRFAAPLVAAIVSFGVKPASAITTWEGDYEIIPDAIDMGNLTVSGGITTDGDLVVRNGIDIGWASGATPFGFSLAYFDLSKTAAFDATKADATFLWRDNVTTSADSKMSLDGNNLLTLFKASDGNAGIILNPNSGAVTLAGSASGIYSSLGAPLLQFGSGGAVFSSEVTFQSGANFGGDAKLYQENVEYLKSLIDNLGYRAGGAATQVRQIPLVGVGQTKIVEAAGSIYVSAVLNNNVGSIGGTSFSSSLPSTAIAKCDPVSGQAVWVKVLSGTSHFTGTGIAVDPLGNVIVSASFGGETSNIGSGKDLISSGEDDGCVIKLSGFNAEALWSKPLAGAGFDATRGVAVDGSGNIIVGGLFTGATTTLGAGKELVDPSGGEASYVVKLAGSDGEVQWSKPIGGAVMQINAVGVDGSGDALLGGSFLGSTTTLGTGKELVSTGIDGFVIKFDSATGVADWTKGVGSAGVDSVRSVTCDGSNNVMLAGGFAGTTATLGFGHEMVSAGSSDGYVVKLAPDGITQWATRIGGPNASTSHSIVVDDLGDIVVGGTFDGTISTLGSAFNLNSAGSTDFFVAKLNSSGTVMGSQSLGAENHDGSFAGLAAVGSSIFVAGGTGSYNDSFAVGNSRVQSGGFIAGWEGLSLSTPLPALPVGLSWNGGGASGSGAVAFGNAAVALGTASVAFGGGLATGSESFAAAGGIATGANAVAFGTKAQALGDQSAAFGEGTRTVSWSSFAAGSYNLGLTDPLYPYDLPLFEIGNGGPEFSQNALTTYVSGRTKLKNQFWSGATPLEVPGGGGDTAAEGEALVVDGHTRLRGKVIIEQPQGDISMGIFE